MNDNEYIAKVTSELLSAGSPLVLASIVNLQGSSPRHSGTKMVVAADGKSYGTIGGSLLEASAINKSKDAIAQQHSTFMTYDLNGADAYSMEMICGGKTFILLDFISPTKENLEFFKGWYETTRKDTKFYFVTFLQDNDNVTTIIGHSLCFPDGKITGTNSWLDQDVEILEAELPGVTATTVLQLHEGLAIVDPIAKIKTLFCFGAGHVAVPTAHIAALTGFRVVIVDDREEFANTERFPEAHETIVRDFEHAMDGLEIDSDSFIIIVTRGHVFDRTVLAQSLKTNAGYIGMIGSKRKRDTIYSALRDQGVTDADIARVHSPVGLDIFAETPEEIAVSIVAELIRERNKK